MTHLCVYDIIIVDLLSSYTNESCYHHKREVPASLHIHVNQIHRIYTTSYQLSSAPTFHLKKMDWFKFWPIQNKPQPLKVDTVNFTLCHYWHFSYFMFSGISVQLFSPLSLILNKQMSLLQSHTHKY